MSYDRELKNFVRGVWIGILNLGILWTAIFLLIVFGHAVVCLVRRCIESGNQNHEHDIRSFGNEFREVYGLGWTILVVVGFSSEFLVHTFDYPGGLFTVLAFGFLPMTLAAVLLAYTRSRT